MPCCSSAAMCSGCSRRASSPPWIVRVQRLHAAVEHLGKAGSSATSVTAQAGSASSCAVPPVDSSLTPSAVQRLRELDEPVLSETERAQ